MTGVGIHDLPRDAYHADPCDVPSLNSGTVKLLAGLTPAHARVHHPRLSPDRPRDEATHFDIGTAAHSLLLEGYDNVEVIYAADWRKQDTKDQRDAARAAGKAPLLEGQFVQVSDMVEATRQQLFALTVEPSLFTDGHPERTLIWEENGVTCRALLDWLRDDRTAVDDYKTTSKSASPEHWSRAMFSFGGDIQAAWYLRGVKALTDVDAEFRFVVVETFEPYALSVFSPGPDVLALADAKIEKAIGTWRECLETDTWPAYSTQVCTVELPPWAEPQWLEKEQREAAV